MVEFEADDAIATAAHRLARDPAVDRVLITAVDKDMCQCVIGERVVCWDRFKDQTLDEAGVIAKHGVAPASIPDLLALVGDTADGIPGLPGWGKSSAGKLLAAYGHISDIPDDPATWTVALRGADRLARALRDHRAEAALYRVLATLRTDCPIECGDFVEASFTARRRRHRVVISGGGEFDPKVLVRDTKRIVEEELEFWGGAPYKHYTFICHVFPGARGGLEHRNSTVLGIDHSPIRYG
jgi:5'-3' exonuclease